MKKLILAIALFAGFGIAAQAQTTAAVKNAETKTKKEATHQTKNAVASTAATTDKKMDATKKEMKNDMTKKHKHKKGKKAAQAATKKEK